MCLLMYNFVSGHDCSVYRNLLRRDQNSYTSGVIQINAQAIHFHQLVPSQSSHQSYVLSQTSVSHFCLASFNNYRHAIDFSGMENQLRGTQSMVRS